MQICHVALPTKFYRFSDSKACEIKTHTCRLHCKTPKFTLRLQTASKNINVKTRKNKISDNNAVRYEKSPYTTNPHNLAANTDNAYMFYLSQMRSIK